MTSFSWSSVQKLISFYEHQGVTAYGVWTFSSTFYPLNLRHFLEIVIFPIVVDKQTIRTISDLIMILWSKCSSRLRSSNFNWADEILYWSCTFFSRSLPDTFSFYKLIFLSSSLSKHSYSTIYIYRNKVAVYNIFFFLFVLYSRMEFAEHGVYTIYTHIIMCMKWTRIHTHVVHILIFL